MIVVAWIFLGLMAGILASKLRTGNGKALVLDTTLGIVGAIVGGVLTVRSSSPRGVERLLRKYLTSGGSLLRIEGDGTSS